MEIIKSTLVNSEEVINNVLIQQKEAVVYCIPDDYCVVIGSNEQVNWDAVYNLGLKYGNVNHEGGVIVTSPGDVEIGIFTKGYHGQDIRNAIVEKIIAKLAENNIYAQISGNDVLINGRKVVGFGSRMFGDILFTSLQVSVNVNLELIGAVCTKPIIKIPDGLSNYGITTEFITNAIFEVLK